MIHNAGFVTPRHIQHELIVSEDADVPAAASRDRRPTLWEEVIAVSAAEGPGSPPTVPERAQSSGAADEYETSLPLSPAAPGQYETPAPARSQSYRRDDARRAGRMHRFESSIAARANPRTVGRRAGHGTASWLVTEGPAPAMALLDPKIMGLRNEPAGARESYTDDVPEAYEEVPDDSNHRSFARGPRAGTAASLRKSLALDLSDFEYGQAQLMQHVPEEGRPSSHSLGDPAAQGLLAEAGRFSLANFDEYGNVVADPADPVAEHML